MREGAGDRSRREEHERRRNRREEHEEGAGRRSRMEEQETGAGDRSRRGAGGAEVREAAEMSRKDSGEQVKA